MPQRARLACYDPACPGRATAVLCRTARRPAAIPNIVASKESCRCHGCAPHSMIHRAGMIGRSRTAGPALAALAAIAILATPAAAQSDYPNRPIQLIVPYGPGGVADVGMRIMAEKLSVRLK